MIHFYWMIILFQLTTLQQIGHLDHKFASFTDCSTAAKSLTGNGQMAICVRLPQSEERRS